MAHGKLPEPMSEAPMHAFSRIRLGTGLALGLAAASCFAHDRSDPVPESEIADPAAAAIAKAAQAVAEAKREASHALETSSFSPPPLRVIEAPADPLDGEISSLNYTIEWNGPVEPLLEALAKSRQASLEIRGIPRSANRNVALYVYDAKIEDIIYELAGQMMGYGGIEFSPAEKKVSLDYGK